MASTALAKQPAVISTNAARLAMGAFPFDPSLRSSQCAETEVSRNESAREQDIEETYCCGVTASVAVGISNRRAGYERSYQLGRLAARSAPIALGRPD